MENILINQFDHKQDLDSNQEFFAQYPIDFTLSDFIIKQSSYESLISPGQSEPSILQESFISIFSLNTLNKKTRNIPFNEFELESTN